MASKALKEAIPAGFQKSFKFGEKAVYLPNAVITLVRKDRTPPNWATFEVPLTFNKFDLRDYLWKLYGVETDKWRVWVDQQPIRRRENGRGYFRPQARKYMMAQMLQPFAFPEPPANKTDWNNDIYEAREKMRADQSKADFLKQIGKLPYPSKQPDDERRTMLRREAKKLLEGNKVWEPTTSGLDGKWEGVVAAVKAEKAAEAVLVAERKKEKTREKRLMRRAAKE
ncbi:54S ribosomal protein L23 [Colletotrichum sidae]|uniref:Large ribosomal subunit protein uL23m n=4 Tax=Colletotrichum orbiculare species complex TaxID=2707354 RepID=N4VAJ2_COLOR|nr:54S ribosomal protein L23 [Colletotrichum orbiculare MAFF 240422]TDZ38956.1 54S ribosomal protein L23 [Colletotrichum spinosum]TDZ58584.1 54S ribosomal protein L23 [Colletotrichum trifolii]TEA20756.1 54S ribosomal protein L23 [Colletotrichum sidae]